QGAEVGPLRVAQLAGVRVDVTGHRGNTEGDGPGQVDQGYPPGPGPGTPGKPGMGYLEPGQRAGHQEADRADRVGPPHVLMCGLRGEVGGRGGAGADVEVDGADQLDRRGPPVDPPRLIGEEPPVSRVLLRR